MVDLRNCFAERTALVGCDLSVVVLVLLLAPVDLAAGMPNAGVFPFDEPDAGATISLGWASLPEAWALVALSEGELALPDAGAAISERVLGGE